MLATNFGNYLRETLFPHIPSSSFFGTKVAFLKNFKRSDLVTKKWANLILGQKETLSRGGLELSRDSTVVFVRDFSKTIREDLTQEELDKWTNQ
jgi:hypothetical protein